MMDVSSQFYINEEDIGKNRADLSLPELQELNPYTKIDIWKGDLEAIDLEELSHYKVLLWLNFFILSPSSLSIIVFSASSSPKCHSKPKSVSTNIVVSMTLVFLVVVSHVSVFILFIIIYL